MRLFVAVELPATVKDELDSAVGALRPSLPDAKWVPRDNAHLTIGFLGRVEDERVDGIAATLRGALAAKVPFTARLGGSGAFPAPRRARVIWAGLESEGDHLGSVATTCIRALEPLGFPPEARPWTAHVTIARLRTPADVSGVLPIALEPVEFAVKELTLFSSRLGRPAPRYEPVARIAFGG